MVKKRSERILVDLVLSVAKCIFTINSYCIVLYCISQIYGDFRLLNFMARHESQVVFSHTDFYKTLPSNTGHF